MVTMKKQPHVLHVEPEKSLRVLFTTELANAGFRIDSASNFKEANDILSANPEIHAAIFGIHKNQAWGLKLATQIKKTRPEIRIILTYGYSECAAIAKNMGVYACLQKPYSINELIDLMSNSAPI
jgi:DNA-binding NtrC family response regulator